MPERAGEKGGLQAERIAVGLPEQLWSWKIKNQKDLRQRALGRRDGRLEEAERLPTTQDAFLHSLSPRLRRACQEGCGRKWAHLSFTVIVLF